MPKAHERWTVLPHGELQEIDDGILTVTGDIVMPLGFFPRRMTVVRLRGHRILVFSAIALDEPQMARIEALGTPSILLVPNPGHRLDAKIWKQRYPAIRVLTPPGARKQVEGVVPVDATTDILDDPDTSFEVAGGFASNESAVIVRRPAGATLIVNDAIGNVRHPHGLGAKIMARLFGFGVHRPQVPRPMRRYLTDKSAFAAQLRAWADMPNLRRIIPSHGEPIDTDPAGELRRLAATIT